MSALEKDMPSAEEPPPTPPRSPPDADAKPASTDTESNHTTNITKEPTKSITVKPLQVVPGFLDREGKSNVRLAPGEPEWIQDVRDLEGSGTDFSLDENGFRYVKAPTEFRDWGSQKAIGEYYLQEMEDLLRRELEGCDEIMFFDARIRQSGPEGMRIEGLSYNPFAKQVHVDQTESSIITKVRNLTEMKADYLLRGRTRIVNVWRPTKHPVYDCALAIADGGKLLPSDVIECDRKRLDTGEFWDTMGVVQYRQGYHWYYMSEQAEEDVLLFKNYDSDRDVAARHCLHTAFDLPPEVVPAGAPSRESIEVRALVFTYPHDMQPPDSPTLRQQRMATPQPLADALQQGQLQRVDRKETIIHMLRQELDQATKAKEAILSLRFKELETAKETQRHLCSDRDHARAEVRALLERLRKVGESLTETRDAQEKKPDSLLWEEMRAHVNENVRLRQELSETKATEASSLAEAKALIGDGAEKQLLRNHIETMEREVAKWREEATGRATLAISEIWKADVDEAVRREREKDKILIESLRKEVARLRAELATREST